MTNFNPNINNLFNALQNMKVGRQANQANAANTAAAGANGANTISQNVNNILNSQITSAQNQAQNTSSLIAQNLIMNLETAKMEQETVLQYMQNLMKLPENIDKFIEQMATNTAKTTDGAKFLENLVQNLISTRELAELLNTNSKEAIQKLFNVISQASRLGITDTSQLKDIMGALNAIQNSTNLSQNSIRELLLLYIPLNYQVFDDEGDFGEFEEEVKSSSGQNALSILFQTINFSNILVTINEEENNLFLAVFAPNSFAFDRFKNIIDTLSKGMNIKAFVDFKNVPDKELNIEKQNFKIISRDYVSANALMLTNIAIRAIFKIDDSLLLNDESIT